MKTKDYKEVYYDSFKSYTTDNRFEVDVYIVKKLVAELIHKNKVSLCDNYFNVNPNENLFDVEGGFKMETKPLYDGERYYRVVVYS